MTAVCITVTGSKCEGCTERRVFNGYMFWQAIALPTYCTFLTVICFYSIASSAALTVQHIMHHSLTSVRNWPCLLIICGITLLERKRLLCHPESLWRYICNIKPTVYCAFVATPWFTLYLYCCFEFKCHEKQLTPMLPSISEEKLQSSSETLQLLHALREQRGNLKLIIMNSVQQWQFFLFFQGATAYH